jgi:hypothetical protein
MLYKAKFGVCSEIHTKHIKALCHHVKFLNVKPGSRLRSKRDGTRAETRFRLSAKRTSPFKSAGASVPSTTGSRGVRTSDSNAGYTKFQCSVKSTGYPLHSPVSPSLPTPVRHRVPSHFNWTLELREKLKEWEYFENLSLDGVILKWQLNKIVGNVGIWLWWLSINTISERSNWTIGFNTFRNYLTSLETINQLHKMWRVAVYETSCETNVSKWN